MSKRRKPVQDWLAVAAGADQCPNRGGADVNDRSRFDSTEDRSRSHRQLNKPQPSPRRQAENNHRFFEVAWDFPQTGDGTPNDRQQAIEKEGDDRRPGARFPAAES